jgi:hypothetical protein
MVGGGTSRGRGKTRPIAMAAVCAALVVLVARPAAAGAGGPMDALTWLLLLPAGFFPIVAIEALVARRMLELGMRDSLKLSLIANAWSTLANILLNTFIWFAGELFAGLLAEGRFAFARAMRVAFMGMKPSWMVPSVEVNSALVLLILAVACTPSLFVSLKIDAWSASHRVPGDVARRWSLRANLITCGLPIAGLLIFALDSYLRS